jgi:uncharacterized membrane protein YdfJ with MMPL/SSD domain
MLGTRTRHSVRVVGRQKIINEGEPPVFGWLGRSVVRHPHPDRTVAQISVILKLNPNSNEAVRLVKGPLRDTAHRNAPPGTTALVGGTTAIFGDINDVNNRDLSAFLVSTFLVPSITALMGHAAWWRGHGDRARAAEPPAAEPHELTGHRV